MDSKPRPGDEWLETDGLGGFASGTALGVRTRRYHALLLSATTPPTGRRVLVNGFEAWVETPAGTFPISSQRYSPGVVHPDGVSRIESFAADPWPRWRYRLGDGTAVEQEIFVPRGVSMTVVCWRLAAPGEGVQLHVRPFLSGRDYHALHRENPSFRFDAEAAGGRTVWRPYAGVPGIISLSNGEYLHAPDWYRHFLYAEEKPPRARGRGGSWPPLRDRGRRAAAHRLAAVPSRHGRWGRRSGWIFRSSFTHRRKAGPSASGQKTRASAPPSTTMQVPVM